MPPRLASSTLKEEVKDKEYATAHMHSVVRCTSVIWVQVLSISLTLLLFGHHFTGYGVSGFRDSDACYKIPEILCGRELLLFLFWPNYIVCANVTQDHSCLRHASEMYSQSLSGHSCDFEGNVVVQLSILKGMGLVLWLVLRYKE